MKQSWYSIKALSEDSAEIFIYDEIGLWGITAKDFIDELKKVSAKNITLRINSPGGDVFDGLAIYNALKRHAAQVSVTVDGIAASMASVVAMAGDKISMPENAMMMIHDPWGFAIGSADEMRDLAEVIDKINSGLISTYVNKSGKSAEEISALMSDETWLTAKEALDLGLADEIAEPIRMAASFSLQKFKKLPESMRNLGAPSPLPSPETGEGKDNPEAAAAPTQASESDNPKPVLSSSKDPKSEADVRAEAQEIVELCAKAGVPEAAADFLGEGLTVEQVKGKFAAADKIRALCAAARVPDRAKNYIKAGMNEDECRKELWALLLHRDATGEINNKLGPEAERSDTQRPKTATSVEIYKLRAQKKNQK
jgi:ATP-dependent Clp protease, protease subunit